MSVRHLGAAIVCMLVSISSARSAAAAWYATPPVTVHRGFAAAALPKGGVVLSGGWQDGAPPRATSAVFVWERDTNRWLGAAPMREARAEHVMLTLGEDRVMALGGRDGQRNLGSSEVWRVGDAAWRDAGNLPFPRRHARALALVDGRVLVFGGNPTEREHACPAQLWDARGQAWSVLAEIVPTCGAGAARLADGRVLVAGGWEPAGAQTSSFIWDPVTRAVTPTRALPGPRAGHTLLGLLDGRALSVGGYEARWRDVQDVATFDPRSLSWTALPMPTSYWGAQPAAVSLEGGDVLVVPERGNVAWRFSAGAGRWAPAAPAPLGHGRPLALAGGGLMSIGPDAPKAQVWSEAVREVGQWRAGSRPRQLASDAVLVVLPDGRALLTGGLEARGAKFESVRRAELFEPASGTWRTTPPSSAGRSAHMAAVLPDGHVLIAGGIESDKLEPPRRQRSSRYKPAWTSAAMLTSSDLWGPCAGWKPTGNLVEGRTGARAVTLLDGQVLMIGGSQATYGPRYMDPHWLTSGTRVLSSTELWSPRTGRWTAAPPLTEPRWWHTATLLADGRVFVVGGSPSDDVDATARVPAELWDPRTQRWTAAASPRRPRRAHAALRLSDGRVLVTGGRAPPAPGRTESTGSLDAVELWDPRSETWTEARPMNAPRQLHAMALLTSGHVLVVGGAPGAVANPEVWDPAADTWTFSAPLAEPTGGNEQLVALRDGRALLVARSSVQLWSP